MENKIYFIEPLFERAEEYGRTSYELFKLKAIQKTTNILSSFILRGLVFLVLFMSIALANIGIALWLGYLLGRLYYGFFCMAGFYGILGGVLYFFMSSRIKKCVNNSIISELLN